ncbi:MAG TPA: nucleotidyltransferase domain-containing protein [Thermoanaerobaculia bacterium]|nr:nucleotidyltransferase domain-containing protein [Thermoanaerobaculia bacterium]
MESIITLERTLGANWSALRAARETTEEMIAELTAAVADLQDSNFAIVVTGSLGRGEATRGSDADWLLLVDGPSDPEHGLLVREINERIGSVVAKEVGRTGTFGGIVAGHELVHYIAGTRDSNENLTRRILLLAESRALTGAFVRERVIHNVLSRYVVYDRSVQSRSGFRQSIPHFLLNDVVRYWRTMGSDYASKMWERQREGWGIRNIKLRFSRKVLFIWGLIAAFAAELFPAPELAESANEDEYYRMLASLIRTLTDVPPLELLARAVLDCHDREVAELIFSSYDEFLGVLANAESREKLEKVAFEEALAEPAYAGLREASKRFREGVTRLFFDAHPKLPSLIRQFGVF